MPGYRKGEESFFWGFYGNLGYRKKLPSGRIVALGHVNRDLLGFTVMTAFPSYEARYIVLEFGSRPSIKTEVLIT